MKLFKNIGLWDTRGKLVYAISAITTTSLQTYAESLYSPVVVGEVSETVIAATQTYAESLYSPVVVGEVSETVIAATQTYTESLYSPTAIGAGEDATIQVSVITYNQQILSVNPISSFSTLWNTENWQGAGSGTNQVRLPLLSGASYDFTVEWGDGSSDLIQSHASPFITHTYASEGIYQINIQGTFDRFYFNNGDERLKLIGIISWGTVALDDFQEFAFYGCANLTSLPSNSDVLNNYVVTGTSMFRATGLTSLPEGLTLNALENGNNMFAESPIATLPESLELAALTEGNSMFYDCDLTALPSAMELTILEGGSGMFRFCNITSISPNMKLSALNSGPNMFYDSSLPTNRYSQLLIDLENLNPNNNVVLSAGSGSYYNSAGETARNALIARGWSFQDAGFDPAIYTGYASSLTYTETLFSANAVGDVNRIYPDADVDVADWTPTPLWSKVNDGSDATSIISTQASNTAIISFQQVPFPTTQQSLLGFNFDKPSGGSDPTIDVEFRDGTTVLATGSYTVTGPQQNLLQIQATLTPLGDYNITLTNNTGGKPADRRETILKDTWITLGY